MASTYYTRRGDDGTTGLLGEGRIAKNDARIEALGTIDEATAAIGVARAVCKSAEAAQFLLSIQRDLYNMMAEVAATRENAEKFRSITPEHVAWLETQTDIVGQMVEMPREFIVPGDSPAGAALDFARTIVRRAERRLVELHQRGDLSNPELLRYANRLSSFCYVLELLENKHAGVTGVTLAKSV